MLDLTKKYRTRRGGEVPVIWRDGDLLHVLEKFRGSVSHLILTLCGRMRFQSTDSDWDLIEIRKLRQWVLTETGEERRHLKPGEAGLDETGSILGVSEQGTGSVCKYQPLRVELRFIDEPSA